MNNNETLDKRISDVYLNPIFSDGDTLLHTQLNEIVSVTRIGINENYYDIQRIVNGTKTVGNSQKLNGATLSKLVDGTLTDSDTKVPTSAQVKAYVDSEINKIV